jgi:endonuclease/exonuclease/phosphatase family metal-dependent hydrolase
MQIMKRLLILIVICLLGANNTLHAAEPAAIRVATYNTSLYREQSGKLVRDLETGESKQARQIAEVIQRVRPDVLLVNEFDFDSAGKAASLFRQKYLAVGQNGQAPIEYPYYFIAPVNTGKPSGRDLDKDGQTGGPADAIGFGHQEGQYGMLVLSRFPIENDQVRTFQNLLWRNMPGALLPTVPDTGEPFYDGEDLTALRLSSKSFWDVPVKVPARGSNAAYTLHLLCSHPTPPVFDGPEDRNGRRNHDEIRLVADYIGAERKDYLVDDAARGGRLPADARFVVLGDLNCDPVDGEKVAGAIEQLLANPRIDASFTPTSQGGPHAIRQFPDQHTRNQGNPSHVTANFTGEGHGCLRIDYALPSKDLLVVEGGVFWPVPGEAGSEAVTASDHRPVWIDIVPAGQ